MNTPRLCNLHSLFPRPLVLLLAGLLGLAPISAHAQFATLLDTTARYAGNSTGTQGFNQDSGVATATELNVPSYVVFDSLGNLYISDTQNNCVRKVSTNGSISTASRALGAVAVVKPRQQSDIVAVLIRRSPMLLHEDRPDSGDPMPNKQLVLAAGSGFIRRNPFGRISDHRRHTPWRS